MKNKTIRIATLCVVAAAVMFLISGLYGGPEDAGAKEPQGELTPLDVSGLEGDVAQMDALLSDLEGLDFNSSLEGLEVAL